MVTSSPAQFYCVLQVHLRRLASLWPSFTTSIPSSRNGAPTGKPGTADKGSSPLRPYMQTACPFPIQRVISYIREKYSGNAIPAFNRSPGTRWTVQRLEYKFIYFMINLSPEAYPGNCPRPIAAITWVCRIAYLEIKLIEHKIKSKVTHDDHVPKRTHGH
jgi:hypothetical protein